MKNFLILITIVGVVGLSLWIYHVITPGPSFLATPEEIAGLIEKNENQIASFFYDKNISRDTSSGKIIYGERLNEGKISLIKDKPLTMFYDFINRKQYAAFFDEVKNIGTKTTYSDSTGTHPAYKIKNCIFMETEYSTDRNYYTEIFSASRSSLMVKEKITTVSDSIAKPQKDSISTHQLSFPTVAYIVVNNASLFKKINNSFDLQGGSLSKGTRLKVIKEDGSYLYCDYEDDNGHPKTAWISNDDITFKTPVKTKPKVVDSEDVTNWKIGVRLSLLKRNKRKKIMMRLSQLNPNIES